MRIKWNTNDISFKRGNFEPLIAKLDNCKVWLGLRAVASASTFKAEVRKLAQTYGATEVEIKKEYREDATGTFHHTEKDVVGFIQKSNGDFYFAVDIPVPESAKRNIQAIPPSEIFESCRKKGVSR